MSETNNDNSYKIVVSGDVCVGKTTLCRLLTDGLPSSEYVKTIGVDFMIKTIESVKFRFWDLAGDPRYEQITYPYVKGTDLILMLYDMNNYNSFLKAQHLNYLYDTMYNGDIQTILVGTHKDIHKIGTVDFEHEVMMYALQYGYEHVNISCKSPDDIRDLMDKISDILSPDFFNDKSEKHAFFAEAVNYICGAKWCGIRDIISHLYQRK